MEKMWNEAEVSFTLPSSDEEKHLTSLISESYDGFRVLVQNELNIDNSLGQSIERTSELSSKQFQSNEISLFHGLKQYGLIVMRNGHCPPPSLVVNSIASGFVATATATQGGPDEFLLAKLQTNMETGCKPKRHNRWTKQKAVAAVSMEEEESQSTVEQSEEATNNVAITTKDINANSLVLRHLCDVWPQLQQANGESSAPFCHTQLTINNRGPSQNNNSEANGLNISSSSQFLSDTTDCSGSSSSSSVRHGGSSSSSRGTTHNNTTKVITTTQLLDLYHTHFTTSHPTILPTDGTTSTTNVDYYTQHLGKRGRHYSEVWEESEYLDSVKQQQQQMASSTGVVSKMVKRLKPLLNWSDLLSEYKDNFDGAYREWFLSQQCEREEQLLTEKKYLQIAAELDENGSKKKKKKRSVDPIFRSTAVDTTNTSNVVELSMEERFELRKIIPPPVPTTVIHPAAWGLRSESHELLPFVNMDFTCVHPGSVLATTTTSGGAGGGGESDHHNTSSNNKHTNTTSKSSSARQTALESANLVRTSLRPVKHNEFSSPQDKRKYVRKTNSTNNSSTQINPQTTIISEDVDDFNILTERLQQELMVVEAANFCRLEQLSRFSSTHTKLHSLTSRRRRLEEVLYRTLKKNEPKCDNRVIYHTKPPQAMNTNNYNNTTTISLFHDTSSSNNSTNTCNITSKHHITQAPPQRSQSNDTTTSAVVSTTSAVVSNEDTDSVATSRSDDKAHKSSLADSGALSSVDSSPAVSSEARSELSAGHRRTPQVGNNANNKRGYKTSNNTQPLLGACLESHISHGVDLLKDLSTGLLVDARPSGSNGWKLCRVVRVQRDGELLRHVKVCPINGLPSSAFWIAAEDGQVAPRGTFTPLIKGVQLQGGGGADEVQQTKSMSSSHSINSSSDHNVVTDITSSISDDNGRGLDHSGDMDSFVDCMALSSALKTDCDAEVMCVEAEED